VTATATDSASDAGHPSWGHLLGWHAIAFVATLVVPALVRLGAPFWRLEATMQFQMLVWGAAYLAFALATTVLARREGGVGPFGVLLCAAVAWSGGYAVLSQAAGVSHSRVIAIGSVLLGTALGVIALRLGRWRWRAWAVPLALVVAAPLASLGGLAAGAEERVERTTRFGSSHHTLLLTRYPDLLAEQPMDGGAIEPYRDGFLVLTASGELWRLHESSTGAIASSRLPLTAPLGRERFLQDHQGREANQIFRATDLAIDTLSPTPTVYVAHQQWNPDARCLTLRVSVAPLAVRIPDAEESGVVPPVSSAGAWRTLYESTPCLAIRTGFDPMQTGGRLAWLARDALLLTVGDHGYAGLEVEEPSVSQDSASHYGKTIIVRLDGRHELYSIGHRNPQGILVAADGRIWSTEHGPQGGDELNLIRPGANYGWPEVTYGTEYGFEDWSLNPGRFDHAAFVEPVQAFVPSIAVSSLIELGGTQFPRWQGDLLLGTIARRAIFRLRIREGRVIYTEPITLGVRVRDLAQARDGRIVIYDGSRGLAVLSRAELGGGERAFATCAGCHGIDGRGTDKGPSLRHLFSQPIASLPGWDYSPALRALGGDWSEERLDRFLQDPAAYAPGTTMAFPGLSDAAWRAEVIGYLKARQY
jgi:cytochrome c2